MISDLAKYQSYLISKHYEHSEQEQVYLAEYYIDKAIECALLQELFDEMKLSPNDWHKIKTLVKEFRSIKNNGKS